MRMQALGEMTLQRVQSKRKAVDTSVRDLLSDLREGKSRSDARLDAARNNAESLQKLWQSSNAAAHMWAKVGDEGAQCSARMSHFTVFARPSRAAYRMEVS